MVGSKGKPGGHSQPRIFPTQRSLLNADAISHRQVTHRSPGGKRPGRDWVARRQHLREPGALREPDALPHKPRRKR